MLSNESTENDTKRYDTTRYVINAVSLMGYFSDSLSVSKVIAGLSLAEASSAAFQNSLRLAVADITGAPPSDVIVTFVESASSSGTAVTVVYTVRSSSSDSASLESSVLDSVASGLMTDLLVNDGYAGVDASAVPEIVILTESPTPSPTKIKTSSPTSAKPSTYSPSIKSAILRTLRPSRLQPTGIPTSTLPSGSNYRMIFFTGQLYLHGIKSTVFNSTTARTDLRNGIAKSMVGVRLRDVTFVKAEPTIEAAPVTLSRLRYMSAKSDDLQGVLDGARAAMSFRSLAVDLSTVTYSVSVPLTAPYVNDANGLYTSLTTQINDGINSGSMLATFQLTSTLRTSTYVSTELGPYTVLVVAPPTVSPTMAPSMIVVIPTVFDIYVHNTTRTTATIDVTLIKDTLITGYNSDGMLYCSALANGTAPTSTGSFKGFLDQSLERHESIAILPDSTFPQTKLLVFTGLNALKSYAIYCYVETSIGSGNSLEAVLATRAVATTACCKMISIVDSPAFVYGDVKKYRPSDTTLYTFNYILSDVPSTSVKVTPTVYINGVVSTQVIATQSNTASLLGGQFILTAPSTFTGICDISFIISGRSALEYTSETYTVEILSSISKIPAPDMESCRFTDSGQYAIIRFRSPTDNGGFIASEWPCSSLFSFINADKSTCSWIDSEAVSISFGVVGVNSNHQYLLPGDILTILPNKIRAFCTKSRSLCASNPTANMDSLIVEQPVNPTSPIVILSAPPSISSCFNLSLDSSASYGDGGRLYSAVRWSVSAVEYGTQNGILDVSNIETYMNAFSAEHQTKRPVIIAGDTLIMASYTITLSLTNFLGLTASKTVIVVASSDRNMPILALLGPSYRSILASDPLRIVSTVSLTQCTPKDTVVEYKWVVTVNGEATSIDNRSKNPSQFFTPSYTLAVDGEYSITVIARAGSSSTSATATVYVAHGPIKAVIVGGTTRCVPIDKILVLDASYTTDSDVPPSAISHLSYEVRNIIILILHDLLIVCIISFGVFGKP